ncbi:DNA polymerase III subunit delta [candidate division KSB1 bacterium]
MAKHKQQDELKRLNRSEIKQTYVFTGAEDYFREAAVKVITGRIRNEIDKEVSIHKIYGEETTADELSVNLSSMSLFSSNKLVYIKSCSKMNKDCWNLIMEFVKDPSEGTILLLEDEKIDGRTDYARVLNEHADRYDFKALIPSEMYGWIKKQAGNRGLNIDEGAVTLLINSTEKGLHNYIRELEKIELFAGESGQVTEELLGEISGSLGSFSVFDFINTIYDGKAAEAINQLKKIFVFKESVPGAIVLIHRHLMILLKIKLYSEKGLSHKEIMSRTGLPPWFFKDYIRQAESFDISDLEELLETLLETDTDLKTGYRTDKMVMTLLVNKIISIINKKMKTEHVS